MESCVIGNLLVSNGAYGIDDSVGSTALNDRTKALWINNAFYGNTTNPFHYASAGTNDVTLTGIPFVDGPGGNFALDPTASEGAACRNAAFPTTFPGGLTLNYSDAGAARHIDPTLPAVGNVRVGTVYGHSSGSTGTLVVGGWTDGSGNLTLAKETGANARGGSGTCAKLTPTNASAYGYWYFYVPVTATAFTLSFYHKITSGFSGLVKCSIYDTDQSTLKNTSEVVTLTDDEAYHQFSATAVTPTATGFCLVRIEVQKDAGDTTECVYIDDIGIA
jgi:hypothetical protein